MLRSNCARQLRNLGLSNAPPSGIGAVAPPTLNLGSGGARRNHTQVHILETSCEIVSVNSPTDTRQMVHRNKIGTRNDGNKKEL